MPLFETLCVLISLSTATVVLASLTDLRGTTLTAPRNWALLALACAALAELAPAVDLIRAQSSLRILRYASGILTFAPFMALLGAKRPQNAAWQFVVLTLLIVLALPAGSSLVYGSRLAVPWMIAWLLWALIGFEVITFLGTRLWPSAVGIAAAQVVGLHFILPGTSWLAESRTAALVAAISGGLIPAVQVMLVSSKPSVDGEKSLRRMWANFRALFGATWSLRVMMMFNDAAERNHWPLRLGWSGCEIAPAAETKEQNSVTTQTSAKSPVDPQVLRGMEKGLRMLLRRFVSPAWVEARWDGTWPVEQGELPPISRKKAEPIK
ncbi:MAG: hypothetical protein MPJ50_17755 [Pirellulales bacterium]|nr:hypothetical protein [Pirellulales bacterium]